MNKSRLPAEILKSIQEDEIMPFRPNNTPETLDLGALPMDKLNILENARNLMGGMPKQVNNDPYEGDRNQARNRQPIAESDDFYVPSYDEIKNAISNKPQQRPVQTPLQQYQQVVPQPQSQAIDYSLIKIMLESIVSEQLGKLGSKLLTENKKQNNTAEFLTIGSSIKFVDKNGNIYEGKLTKTGNINGK